MTRIKLQFVNVFRDRHGKVRYYFRRPGRKSVALPGPPGSERFMKAYAAALAGDAPRLDIGASRSKPGTWRPWLPRILPRLRSTIWLKTRGKFAEIFWNGFGLSMAASAS